MSCTHPWCKCGSQLCIKACINRAGLDPGFHCTNRTDYPAQKDRPTETLTVLERLQLSLNIFLSVSSCHVCWHFNCCHVFVHRMTCSYCLCACVVIVVLTAWVKTLSFHCAVGELLSIVWGRLLWQVMEITAV